MGTFAEYIGAMDVPEDRRAEYARQMLGLLHAGGSGADLIGQRDLVGNLGRVLAVVAPSSVWPT